MLHAAELEVARTLVGQLLAELRKLRMEGIQALINGIGATMKRFIPFFKLYTTYIKGQRKAQKDLMVTTSLQIVVQPSASRI